MLYIWNLYNIMHQLYLNKKNLPGDKLDLVWDFFFPRKIKKKIYLNPGCTLITVTE